MNFDRLKNWIVKTWKYDCSHPEWLIVKTTLFCMGTGLVFLFCGWRVIGNVFFLIGCGVLVIPPMILFLLVLLEEASRKTSIPNMLKIENALDGKLANIVQTNNNPVDELSKTFDQKLAEFSTSMEFGWLSPVLNTFETAGIPGRWSAIGDYLACEFEKLRDGACKAWTLHTAATAFYIVLEREDFDTLSIWICSADKSVMEKLNAAADAQIDICEGKTMGGNE